LNLQVVVAQQFNGPGFRLFMDENKRVVAAEYHGEAGINFLVGRGKAQSSEFAPPNKLHVYPHLESLTYPYGFTLTAEDVGYLAALQNLKEIELGFVGVSSEYVSEPGAFRNVLARVDGRVAPTARGAIQRIEFAAHRFRPFHG
jgi:hypothetical protein